MAGGSEGGGKVVAHKKKTKTPILAPKKMEKQLTAQTSGIG